MATRTAERTAVLPAPPEAVWAAVMSPEIAPVIDPSVRAWRPDREPIGLGTRFTIRGRVGVVPIRGTSEVVRWEPHEVAVFESRGGGGPLRVTATHALEPAGDETRYTWRMVFEGPGPAPAVSAWLFGRAIERQQRTLASYLRRR